MRLGDRDVQDREGRTARQRHYHPDPDPHGDWEVPDDVLPASAHYNRAYHDEVQRHIDRAPEVHSRSRHAPQYAMQPPPLSRYASETYGRPREPIEYKDRRDERVDRWSHARHPRDVSPGFAYGRRPERQPREPREPSPASIERPSTAEGSLEDDQIEVVEEPDEHDASYRHRRHRHSSREHHREPSEESRHRSGRRQSMPPHRHHREENEIIVYPSDSSSEHEPPVRRPPLRRGVSDPPRHARPHKAVSMIETSRPPVASKRTTKLLEDRDAHRDREGRPRGATTLYPPRRSRSFSRRPPSIIGSLLGGSSRQTSPERPPKCYVCFVCLTDTPSTKCLKVKCGHRWCTGCLKSIFQYAIKDPSQMPPKCCRQNISLHLVEKAFDRKFKKKWNRKFAEYSTKNRIYCPSRRCGEWIPPDCIHRDRKTRRKLAHCKNCSTDVCGTCNGKWHGSRPCPKDEENERFLEQVKEEGYQRCHNCRYVIELKEGCNHMTCRCGAEFCMICGTKWKNCECPLFSDDMGDLDDLEEMQITKELEEEAREILSDEIHPDDNAPIRSRAKMDEKVRRMKRIKERSKEGLAHRRPIYIEEEEYDAMNGMNEMPAMGDNAGHFMNEHYGRQADLAPPQSTIRAVGPLGPPGPPGPAVPPEYGAAQMGDGFSNGSSRNRNQRGGSMERRLMDRFSENRQAPAAMPLPNSQPPMMYPQGHMLVPPPMGMPPMAEQMANAMYQPPIGLPAPQEQVNADHEPIPYGGDESYQPRTPPRGRKHRNRKSRGETTPSSTLAGLRGRSRGANRVDSWRQFVPPGEPPTVSA